MDNAFGKQKLIKGVILEFSTIVTLQNNNLCIELRFYDVIEVWSSIKVTNHRILDEVVILDGPQTSLCIRLKGWVGLYGFEIKKPDVVWLKYIHHKIR